MHRAIVVIRGPHGSEGREPLVRRRTFYACRPMASPVTTAAPAACPACAAPASEPAFTASDDALRAAPGVFACSSCAACGTTFADQRPDDVYRGQLRVRLRQLQRAPQCAQAARGADRRAPRRAGSCAKPARARRCSTSAAALAGYLERIAAEGWVGELRGAEFAADVAERTARRLGIRVDATTAEEADLGSGEVGVLVLRHVIEHLRDPGAFLDRARDALPDASLLYLATPDAHALSARVSRPALVGLRGAAPSRGVLARWTARAARTPRLRRRRRVVGLCAADVERQPLPRARPRPRHGLGAASCPHAQPARDRSGGRGRRCRGRAAAFDDVLRPRPALSRARRGLERLFDAASAVRTSLRLAAIAGSPAATARTLAACGAVCVGAPVLRRTGRTVTVRVGDYDFHVDHVTDLHVLREVWDARIYDTDVTAEPALVLDVGANIGTRPSFTSSGAGQAAWCTASSRIPARSPSSCVTWGSSTASSSTRWPSARRTGT